jgi:hypothetical protein
LLNLTKWNLLALLKKYSVKRKKGKPKWYLPHPLKRNLA